ncbi:putative membrane protein YdjX (TVP38/TMEM64 family) [Paenibacillus castaneae]|uniref:TVP38/TMEM64 family protein n=1 Tax=Paenibacillus castaneae TaxID=474957 RepID=UPI000C9C5D6D|nr:VTT domain-containing protein [Paenibacillus castaneae]NIK80272.1 putative membrane protein YdjX (TVP38/TMEM64 family) [Paenibacillus castaneae]
MNKRSVRLTIFAAIVISVLILLYSEAGSYLLHADLDQIRQMTNDNLVLMLLILFIMMVIQNLFTLIPILLVISVNISLFGLWYGYLWSLLTSIVAATITFYAVRLWFQDVVNKRLKRGWVDKIEQKGYWYVFIGRIFPFVPTSLINIASGVSAVKVKHFIISTAIGNFVYFAILSLIADRIMFGFEQGLYVGIAVVVIGIIVAGVWKRKKTKKKQSDSIY